ncbi:DUF6520 family protein [Formosa haliotis]|uniref:DUF6520 family protein n=1 Tax=Formosa haliotis TaxID=1555194 RepID=UPI0008246777|nr:DUF6520 family protein [Formosa haliotis]
MKTSFFKFIMPAFAILLAVGLAFASNSTELLNVGYIQGPSGPIQVQVDCESEVEEPCTYLEQQVFKDQNYNEPMTKSLP